MTLTDTLLVVAVVLVGLVAVAVAAMCVRAHEARRGKR